MSALRPLLLHNSTMERNAAGFVEATVGGPDWAGGGGRRSPGGRWRAPLGLMGGQIIVPIVLPVAAGSV